MNKSEKGRKRQRAAEKGSKCRKRQKRPKTLPRKAPKRRARKKAEKGRKRQTKAEKGQKRAEKGRKGQKRDEARRAENGGRKKARPKTHFQVLPDVHLARVTAVCLCQKKNLPFRDSHMHRRVSRVLGIRPMAFASHRKLPLQPCPTNKLHPC